MTIASQLGTISITVYRLSDVPSSPMSSNKEVYRKVGTERCALHPLSPDDVVVYAQKGLNVNNSLTFFKAPITRNGDVIKFTNSLGQVEIHEVNGLGDSANLGRIYRGTTLYQEQKQSGYILLD
jgi:hypothetical protein